MKEGVILLVEDNQDDEMLTRRALKKNNIKNEIIVAHDGAEALTYLFGEMGSPLEDNVELPLVVLLDLNLPKLNGLEVLRRIRSDERTRIQPVVVLSSSREDSDIARSYALGVNSYVRKPVEYEEFINTVGMMGTYWISLNESPHHQMV